MKFIRLHVDRVYVVGIAHDYNRVERAFTTANDDEATAMLAQRAVDALNACSELSEATVTLMAKGGTRLGSLTERVVMAALLWGQNGRLAEKLLAQARTEIKKAGGKI